MVSHGLMTSTMSAHYTNLIQYWFNRVVFETAWDILFSHEIWLPVNMPSWKDSPGLQSLR